MRIQHNIMAMNAYRNYNTNTSALSKNLEKLSSGYKINRAGDDAAGLAISEKMRAQITGLNAAQKNVKDGISLVKTAEGAMQEIQDMLNRMDYLATQSANGTYDDPVDRKNLQKEVEALQTEINRIADSANFNGIKLLDGSLQDGSTAKADALAAADAAQKAADAALADAPNAKGEAVYGAESKFTLPNQVANNNPTNASSGTILETVYKDAGKPGFAVNLNGVSHVFNDITDTTAGDDNAKNFTLTIGDAKVTVTEAEIAAAYQTVNGTAAKNGDTADSKVLAQALATKIGAAGLTVNTNDTYAVKLDGEQLVFETTDTQADPTRHYNVSINGVTGADVAATADVYTSGALTQAGTAGNLDSTVTIKYTDADGNEQSKDITFKSGATAGASATNLIAAINADDDLKALFTAGGSDTGITLTAKTAGADAPKVTGLEVKSAGTDGVAIANGSTTTAGKDAYTSGTTGYTNIGTEVTVQAGTPAIDQLASTYVTLTVNDIKDGTQIRIGDETYTFSIGKDSAFKDAENVVRVEDLIDTTDVGADGTLTATGLDKMITKLAEVAKDNKTFTVSHTGTDGKIGFKQLAEVKDSTDMSTMDKLQGFFGISQVDADKTNDANAEAVKAAKEEAAKLQAKADELKKAADKAVDGKALTLQIGDTSDDFNQMKVSIGDMHVNAMGKGKLNEGTSSEKEITKSVAEVDISDQEGAHEAIDIVKNAINYVSGVRGDLGAIQNRLEHTANNLSVMAENIQDAESTIRDTDIAEEMMSYTKNNILIQSAQAMLAQANAVPQGVLQLLG